MKVDKIAILKNLSRDEREVFLRRSITKEIVKGNFLFEEGEVRNKFFILLSGRVKLFRRLADENETFHIFTDGDFLSEASLLEMGGQHSLNGQAEIDSTIIEIGAESFLKFSQEHPVIAFKIVQGISRVLIQRLYHADNKLLTLHMTGKYIAAGHGLVEDFGDILEAILDVIKADRAVGLVKENVDKFQAVASRGYKTKQRPDRGLFGIESDILLKKIFDQRESIIISREHAESLKHEVDIRWGRFDSAILTPVIVDNKIKAIIVLFDKEDDEFNLNNKILLEAVAQQMEASILLKEITHEERAKQLLKRVYY
mgnify:CR=1 FL=1